MPDQPLRHPLGRPTIGGGVDPALISQLLEDLKHTPDGRGTYVVTRTGATFHSEIWGRADLSQTVYDAWSGPALHGAALDGDPGGIGTRLMTYLGLPTKSSTTVGDAEIGWFERGAVVARHGGAAVVHGPVHLHWLKLGGPTGWVGLPTSGVERAPGVTPDSLGAGLVCHLDACDIYWSQGGGAAEVHGLIRDRYDALGGPAGPLGYPLTDETPAMGGAGEDATEVGRFNRFDHGVVFWSGDTGAWEVTDDFLALYQGEGGPAGRLGFPTSERRTSPGGGASYQNFSGGVIARVGDDEPVTITSLGLYVDRFEAKGDDTAAANQQDPWIDVDVWTSVGGHDHFRFPEHGYYQDRNDIGVGKTLLTIPVRDGALRIDVVVVGTDDDDWPSDPDPLGKITAHHTVDDLWAPSQSGVWNSDLRIFYDLRRDLPYDATQVRQDMFWSFKNPKVKTLTYEEFAQTFTDVSDGETWLRHPFNKAFFTYYESFGQLGLCFGLSLEAARAHHGHSLSSEPIHRYSQDQTRMNEAIVKHGYQLGGDQIDWFAGEFVAGHTHDPVGNFHRSRAAYARGDYPILSLSRDPLYGTGHAVMPYHWDDSRDDVWVMRIANPNNPIGPDFTKQGDDEPGNVVEIHDPHSDSPSFRYQHKDDDLWTGGRWSGGRMLAIPYHVLCAQPRTPFWEAALALVGATIILCADADTEDVSLAVPPTSDGRVVDPRVFDPRVGGQSSFERLRGPGGGIRMPVGPLMRDLGPHEITLPDGVVPFPFHDGPGRALAMMRVPSRLLADPANAGLVHRLAAGSDFTWGFAAPGMAAVLTSAGGRRTDQVTVDAPDASRLPSLTFAAHTGDTQRSLSAGLTGAAAGGAAAHFDVDNVVLAPGQALTVALGAAGEHLELRPSGTTPVGVSTQVQVSARRADGTLVPRTVDLSAGAVRLQPTDWRPERLAQAGLTVQTLHPDGSIAAEQTL